ncbi:MAG: sulfotransferase [Solidesulfovibrio sp.]|uniref:sulfotransferase family protein n=1 Tax=Solidesulfovibrio sp. TaxID=2910990 RepID=UPI0031594D39
MTDIPQFIIGGAPRSGTTWFCHALDRHPAIVMAKPFIPEPKFFHRDELYAKGLDHYRATWFPDPDPACVYGEKGSYYLENPACARRIRDCLPGVKLLFTLRDPVERAYSNYVWSRMNGHEDEDFQTALELEETREANLDASLRFVHPNAYFSRGLYARLLAPYYALFAAERILCLRFEDLRSDPEAVLTRVHAFLGVAPRPEDAQDLGRVNPSRDTGVPPLTEETRQWLRERYAGPNRELAALLGPEFRPW